VAFCSGGLAPIQSVVLRENMFIFRSRPLALASILERRNGTYYHDH
jgi:hypothetical protein